MQLGTFLHRLKYRPVTAELLYKCWSRGRRTEQNRSKTDMGLSFKLHMKWAIFSSITYKTNCQVCIMELDCVSSGGDGFTAKWILHADYVYPSLLLYLINYDFNC